MKKNTLWKFNEDTNRPKYLNIWVYVVIGITYFLSSIITQIIIYMMRNEFTVKIVFPCIINALVSATQFLIILYIIMALIGWLIRAEGDFLTRRVYNSLIRRRSVKYIQMISEAPLISMMVAHYAHFQHVLLCAMLSR